MMAKTIGSQTVPSTDGVNIRLLFAALKWSANISTQGAINIAPTKIRMANHAERA